MTTTLAPASRALCRDAIERRFGWLKRELVLHRGNVSALPQPHQILWFGRQKVIQRFNVIGTWRDREKREKAYRKLMRELKR
jgi:hypothetical protein